MNRWTILCVRVLTVLIIVAGCSTWVYGDDMAHKKQEVIAEINNQAILAEIAKNDKNESRRIDALRRLDDQVLLAEFVKNDDVWVRETATKKLND